jgi:hypothetical protein
MKRFLFLVQVAFVLAISTATCMAQDAAMFNYQGLVRVSGQPFTGNGQFKFAILSTNGLSSLWSNDGTSVDGGEPGASLTIAVSDGVFNVMIGDPTLGMQTINPTIFNSQTPLKLRTWFNDGTHGFQQLLPDSRLTDLTLKTLATGDVDFTIYVNGATGNDADSGLTPAKAKKTIQAAVDTLPGRLKCNVTIDIADGVYREMVKMTGISCAIGKELTLLGDDTWTTASAGDPTVRITGADTDLPTPTAVRQMGLHAAQCTGIVLKGLLFDYATWSGAFLTNGSYRMERCKASHCTWGISPCQQTNVNLHNCVASQNTVHGIGMSRATWAEVKWCKGFGNGNAGLAIDGQCGVIVAGTDDFSNNGVSGIMCNAQSNIGFVGGTVGKFNNNGQYGAVVSYMSYISSFDSAGIQVLGTARSLIVSGSQNLP